MVFKKNDPKTKEWQRKGGRAQVENRRQAIDLLWENWRTGFAEMYEQLMKKLTLGEDLTKSQQEFCDRYEKNLEFVTPKRAREDGKGNADTGTKIFIGDESRENAKKALDDFMG